jgi:hypothetical protein
LAAISAASAGLFNIVAFFISKIADLAFIAFGVVFVRADSDRGPRAAGRIVS